MENFPASLGANLVPTKLALQIVLKQTFQFVVLHFALLKQ